MSVGTVTMIELETGDLLKADVEALVNAVNTVGVMGKGTQTTEVPSRAHQASMAATSAGRMVLSPLKD